MSGEAERARAIRLEQEAEEQAERHRLAEEHYGEPVTALTRGGLTLWAPTSLVEQVRADRDAAALAEAEADLAAAHADLMATCTCPGDHDDEAECPVSPPCTCGPYFDPYCPRDGDPAANSPV